MAQPPLKKISKQHGDDIDCPRPKKPKSTGASITDPRSGQPCHSSRPGAGSGGHILQLKQVGAMIEAPQRVLKPSTTLSNDTTLNPVSPSHSGTRSWRKVIYLLLHTSETSLYTYFFLREDLHHPIQLLLSALSHHQVELIELTRGALHLRLIFILGWLTITLAFMSQCILSHLGQSPILKPWTICFLLNDMQRNISLPHK